MISTPSINMKNCSEVNVSLFSIQINQKKHNYMSTFRDQTYKKLI